MAWGQGPAERELGTGDLGQGTGGRELGQGTGRQQTGKDVSVSVATMSMFGGVGGLCLEDSGAFCSVVTCF